MYWNTSCLPMELEKEWPCLLYTSTQEAEKIVRKAIEIGENAVPGVKCSYKITGDRPPVETHMESGLMKALSESFRKSVPYQEPSLPSESILVALLLLTLSYLLPRLQFR